MSASTRWIGIVWPLQRRGLRTSAFADPTSCPGKAETRKRKRFVPRVRNTKPSKWRTEPLRHAVLAGLGEPGPRASIREMRGRVARIVEQYVASLSLSGAEDLRKELVGQGFVGRGALEAFGQKVVIDIAGERQSSFRGVVRGGPPGSRP